MNLKNMLTFIVLMTMGMAHQSANADIITWGAATDSTDVSNVSGSGTFVRGGNGGASSVTIGDAVFSTFSIGSTTTGFLAGGATGDVDFDTLLDEMTVGGGVSTTVDLGALTAGRTYEVQVFFGDQRAAVNDRVMTIGDTGVGTAANVDLEADPNNAIGAPFGQFAIGTFDSDGSDVDLRLDTNGFNNAHVAAWQLRDVTAVPEPASGLLLVFGVNVWAMVSRKRR